MWFESMWFKITYFCAQLFNLKRFLALSIVDSAVAYKGSLSLFDAWCHEALLSERSDVPMSNIPKLLMFLGEFLPMIFHSTPLFHPIPVPLSRPIICGVMLPMFLSRFIGITLFVLHPKQILILSPLLISPNEKSLSQCPHLSMEALAWLVWVRVLYECDLLIAGSSHPIVTSDKKKSFILVRLVLADWHFIHCLEGYYPIWVDNGVFDGILLR